MVITADRLIETVLFNLIYSLKLLLIKVVSDKLKAVRVRLLAFIFSVYIIIKTVKNSNLILFLREVRLKPTYNSQFNPLNVVKIVEAFT